ncbi:hypothetical protein BCEN4_850010 [Burkholderia cenocepacia]|nr:hypothetical protein BCEN4_850010 [Burkholderia cenocepacia]
MTHGKSAYSVSLHKVTAKNI